MFMEKKSLVVLCISLLMVSVLIFAGCSSPAPSAPSAAAPAPAPAQAPPSSTAAAPAPAQAPSSSAAPAPASTQPAAAAAAKVIELKLNDVSPANTPEDLILIQFGEKLKAASNGRLTVRVYPASSLVPAPDTWDAVAKGLCDMASMQRFDMSGRPFGQYLDTFAWGVNATQSGHQLIYDVYDKFPQYQAEWKANKILYFYTTGESPIYTVKKEIHTPADMKGLQIRVPGIKGFTDLIKSLEAAPVTMPIGDVFSAVQKGVVDGCSVSPEGLITFKLGDIVKNVTKMSLWTTLASAVYMNIDSYNNLPPDLKKIFDENVAQLKQDAWKVWNEQNAAGYTYAAGKGAKIIVPTAAEVTQWQTALNTFNGTIAKTLDGQGFPGTEAQKFIADRVAYYNSQK
jgi:TRAP-type transport system periplasmic protein